MDNITRLPDGSPYQKMYAILFNAVTDALDLLEGKDYATARLKLIDAQRSAEELYLDGAE